MTKIINFNKKRKAKAREDDKKQAEQNRAKFGRTREEKKRDKLLSEQAKRHIEGHKLDSGDEE